MDKLDIEQIQKMQLDTLNLVHAICEKHEITYYLIGGALIGSIRHKGFVPWDDDIDIAMMRTDYDKFLKVCKNEIGDAYFLQTYETDQEFYLPIARLCIKGTYIYEYYSDHLKYHKGLYFDIFPLDYVPDEASLRDKQEKQLKLIDKLIFYKQYMVYHDGPFKIKRVAKKLIKLVLSPISYDFLMKRRIGIMLEYADQPTGSVCSTGSRYGYRKFCMPADLFNEAVLLEFEGNQYYAPCGWDTILRKIYGDYMQVPEHIDREPMHEVYLLPDNGCDLKGVKF